MKTALAYIIVGALLVLLLFKSCGTGGHFDDEQPVKVDTLVVIKTIKADTINIIDTLLVPKLVYKTDPKYLAMIAQLKNDKLRLERVLSDFRTRVYDTTYAFDRGTLRIQDSVQGFYLGKNWSLVLDEVTYEERTITKIYEKKPKFALSAGLGVSSGNGETGIGPEIGVRNKKGYQLEASYNTLNVFEMSLKKDIFVKY